MEIVIPLVSGIGLLMVGGRIGFALGRAYEKKIAIEVMRCMAIELIKRLGGNPNDAVSHITAIRDRLK